MIRRALFALTLTVGAFVSPAQAVEMFTNFNNGTELGTRPYGIDVMPPVRYHAYPQGRWFHGPLGNCENSAVSQAVPVASSADAAPERTAVAPQPRDDRPTEIRPEIVEPASERGAATFENQWIRSRNFLPSAQGN